MEFNLKNIYEERYYKLVNHYKNLILEGYVEKHHIIPKCMGGSNDPENIVTLTAKAHYVAHHLLHKAYPENRKLANAFAMMICGNIKNPNSDTKRIFTASMYESGRKAASLAHKGSKRPELGIRNQLRRKHPILIKKPPEPNRHAFDEYNKRKKLEGFSEYELETKRKAGRARKGIPMSEEGKKSYSKAALIRQKNAPILTCPHCNHQQKRSPNLYLYHFNNCSQKN